MIKTLEEILDNIYKCNFNPDKLQGYKLVKCSIFSTYVGEGGRVTVDFYGGEIAEVTVDGQIYGLCSDNPNAYPSVWYNIDTEERLIDGEWR